MPHPSDTNTGGMAVARHIGKACCSKKREHSKESAQVARAQVAQPKGQESRKLQRNKLQECNEGKRFVVAVGALVIVYD